jgi:hypothetical protein
MGSNIKYFNRRAATFQKNVQFKFHSLKIEAINTPEAPVNIHQTTQCQKEMLVFTETAVIPSNEAGITYTRIRHCLLEGAKADTLLALRRACVYTWHKHVTEYVSGFIRFACTVHISQLLDN